MKIHIFLILNYTIQSLYSVDFFIRDKFAVLSKLNESCSIAVILLCLVVLMLFMNNPLLCITELDNGQYNQHFCHHQHLQFTVYSVQCHKEHCSTSSVFCGYPCFLCQEYCVFCTVNHVLCTMLYDIYVLYVLFTMYYAL